MSAAGRPACHNTRLVRGWKHVSDRFQIPRQVRVVTQKKFLLPPTHAALDFHFTRSFEAELLILQLCWSVRNSGSMHRGEWLNFRIILLV
jgi:hypothetical protein